jgi:hypothetical protein
MRLKKEGLFLLGLVVFIFCLLYYGCSKSAPEAARFARGKEALMDRKAAAPAPAEVEGAAKSGQDAAANKPVADSRKLIVRVSLTIEVKDIKARTMEAEKIAEQYGGFIGASEISSSEQNEQAVLTLMIPSDKVNQALARVRELGKVRYETRTSEDVTRQFIDLGARINNLKKEEASLSALLSRSGKLSDIIEIENELSRVRTEIEQNEGQLRFLGEQTSFSTVTVSLATKPIPQKLEDKSLKSTAINAWNSLLSTVTALLRVAIYLGVYLPLMIGMIICVYILIWLKKKVFN